jgi:hypothetical protein
MGTLFGGGASRDRTGDLYNAIVALSQLSYGPTAGKRRILGGGQQRVKRRPRLLAGTSRCPEVATHRAAA